MNHETTPSENKEIDCTSDNNMPVERKKLHQLFFPIFFEILFMMLAGMVDTLMLSSEGDQVVGAADNGKIKSLLQKNNTKTKSSLNDCFLFYVR